MPPITIGQNQLIYPSERRHLRHCRRVSERSNGGSEGHRSILHTPCHHDPLAPFVDPIRRPTSEGKLCKTIIDPCFLQKREEEDKRGTHKSRTTNRVSIEYLPSKRRAANKDPAVVGWIMKLRKVVPLDATCPR